MRRFALGLFAAAALCGAGPLLAEDEADLFTKLDANKDGFVTSEELKIWVLKSFRNLAEEEGLDRFEEEDLNEDGYVTWAEHIKDNFDIDNEFTEVITDPENQQMIAEGILPHLINCFS